MERIKEELFILFVDRIQDDVFVVKNLSNLDIPVNSVFTSICIESDIYPISLSLVYSNILGKAELAYIPSGYSAGVKFEGEDIKKLLSVLTTTERNVYLKGGG